MIDLKRLRSDPEAFRAALGRKRYRSEALDTVLDLDDRVRRQRAAIEELRSRRNTVSKSVPKADPETRAGLLEEMKSVGASLKALEPELRAAEEELNAALCLIPNPPHPDAPDGGEEDSVTIRVVGEPPRFDFKVQDHVELGEARDWIDVPRAARASGSRFAYLKGDIVNLEWALVRLALDRVQAHGFTPVVPPVLVRESAMYGTGFFPADRNEIYRIEGEDAYLVGTSEVSLAALHMGETLEGPALPLRYGGFSTCFRKEAGTYGKDTRGIFRVHQFDKVEMFSFTRPEESGAEHDLLLSIQEEILQALELPYRVVNIATGDLGAPAARKYDLEAWMPGQDGYREITSCSNCTDFQARRLNTRYRTDGNTALVHTLNGTAVAVGRCLIALLENHQQEDGSVKLPAALQPLLGNRQRL